LARRITWLVFLAWLVVGVAIWQTATLFPHLDLDRTRDYLVLAAMAAVLEMIAPGHPAWAEGSFGRLSAGFAVLLTAELVFGPAPAVCIWSLAALAGQGVANRGHPLRTTVFNAAGYTLVADAAARAWNWLAGHYALGPAMAVQALVFTAVYYLAGGILRSVFRSGHGREAPAAGAFAPGVDSGFPALTDVMGWDLFTYLVTLPFGLVLAVMYTGGARAFAPLLFLPLLAVGLILRRLVPAHAAERELAVWHRVAARVSAPGVGAGDPGAVLGAVARLVPCHAVVLFLWSDRGECFQVEASRGAGRLERLRLLRQDALVTLLTRERRPLLISDTRREASLAAAPGPAQLWRSLALFPLFEGEELTGILLLGDKRTAAFTPRHEASANLGAAMVGLIAARTRARTALVEAGAADSLTGVYDSRFFRLRVAEEAGRARRSGIELAVALFSLDSLTAVKEKFGPARAESLWVEAAGALARLVRPVDVVGFWGDGCLGVLMPATDRAAAAPLVDELAGGLRAREFALLDGTAVRLAVRAVWTVYPSPGQPPDAAALLGWLAQRLAGRG